ncbi:ABC transporter permease [Clostridium estertheticum]|uniref:ABC transporter permease n=3 Tax=Clostridium estertheticum TaxID=238834 RepID=UPI001C7DC8C0|nr:ABC transporter permease [Clostridium estertheticum]MBX4265689.1 FtsX-like permease family protein [Clostridium estertheticum]MBX4271549.1 FtsX-like permease family protein [Clostridium estertheticum]WLC82239.1 FtsX-like permease family protein [Clostridium estertheticum]WLC90974.1 FtsX-like permease family protein [Clostridium estertheticum]
MKIMNEYTYNHMKKNKRHTISILVAITIASALLCSLCIFIHSTWETKLSTTIEHTGYWHGELYNYISGDKLKYVTENPEVESTMIKGQWVTAKLSNTKRPYLSLRDANTNFWLDMNLKNNLTEGKLPKKSGEIVVSKLFLSENPSYKIGDKLTLPTGNRMLGSELVNPQSTKQSGEKFLAKETNIYTIVGELDVSGSSAYPGYVAMGYLDPSHIKPKDELTVYMRFVNPRTIYETLPRIAKATGLTKNEHGEYAVKYNTPLLTLYGISDKSVANAQIIMMIAMAITIILLVMGSFILIIYNAFSLSANSRIKELSILKSLGATPRQIKFSVLYEGLLLWIIQLPIGIMVGYLFSNIVFSKVNKILSVTEDYRNAYVSFSWVVVGFSIIISLITVLVSAYIPARKMMKVSAITGIRQNRTKVKFKKQKSHSIINKIFGIEGELAISQFSANKKALRTAVLSLSMCFILIAGYMNIIAIYNLVNSKNAEIPTHDMKISLKMIDKPSDKMINEVISLPEVSGIVIRRQVRTSTYVTTKQESDVFAKYGGFAKVPSKHNILSENGKYRIITNLVGLSDKSFKKYCEKIGADDESYYKEGVKGVLLDSTNYVSENTKTIQKIPLLNIKQGDKLVLNEKIENDMNTNYKFNAEVAHVTEISPSEIKMGGYSLAYIVPMKTYQQIVSNFMPERMLESNSMSIDLLIGDEASPRMKKELTRICSSYLGAEDFTIWSLLDEKNDDELKQKSVSIGVFSVALMFGLIGIINAFSTISNSLRLRKREFAMLRAVGLTPKGLNKMLMIEGLFFALTPIIVSIPIVLFICWFMLRLTLITWSEFISVFPAVPILAYAMLIIASIFLAYGISSTGVKKSNVIESIKDEIV